MLIAMYLAVSRLDDSDTFHNLLHANDYFKGIEVEWYLLFTEPNIFEKLQQFATSAERSQFNLFVLRQAIKDDLAFIVEDLLDGRAPITDRMVNYLLSMKQYKTLIELISIPKSRSMVATRPKWLVTETRRALKAFRDATGTQLTSLRFARKSERYLEDKKASINQDYIQGDREISFLDIINQALMIGEKTRALMELMKSMKNEVIQKNITDAGAQLNYKEIYRLFVRYRKIKMLRYLFNLKLEFEFSVHLFIIALEEDAFDVACLIHREFAYLMRELTPEETRLIVTNIVSSMSRVNP